MFSMIILTVKLSKMTLMMLLLCPIISTSILNGVLNRMIQIWSWTKNNINDIELLKCRSGYVIIYFPLFILFKVFSYMGQLCVDNFYDIFLYVSLVG